MKPIALFVAVVLIPLPTMAGSFVYVSLDGGDAISIFRRDADSGALELQENAAVPSAPGALCVDPQRRFLFASLRTAGRLASFRIEPETGGLSLVSDVPGGDDPAYVATDRTGRFLLSAYYVAGKAAVHAIGDDGSLSAEPVSVKYTDEKAHSIVTDATNRFALVPHTGPNAIFQFHFDDKTGALTPNAIAKIGTGDGTGPRHIGFHPNNRFAYADNEQGSSVTAFRFDATAGTLSPFQTLSTLPEGFAGENSCARLAVHPSGRFVYAANRGHDSIAMFAIDSETGRLTSLGQAPTEKTPRGFDIDPTGRFLYAAGQSADKLAAYRIDPGSGRLQRFATYPTGKRPWWVLAVEIPQ